MRRGRAGHGDDRGAAVLTEPEALELASWSRRAVGALPDWVAPVVLSFAARWWVGGAFGLAVSFVAGAWVLANGWWNGTSGQSVGKRLAGLRVLGEVTAEPIGGRRGLLRVLAHLVDSLACYVGWLLPLGDAKRQTIGDKIMRTLVVVNPR